MIVDLDQRMIDAGLHCPPGQRRVELVDGSKIVPGLYIEVREKGGGEGTFYLRYRAGTTKHLKIGSTRDLTLQAARKRAREERARILMGSDPRAEEKARKSVPTFKQFVEETFSGMARARKRTWRNDEIMLRLRLLPAFGSYRLDTITRKQITQYHVGLQSTHLSPASMDHDLRLLKRIMNVAVQLEVIQKSPAQGVAFYAVDNRRDRTLTEEELKRLLTVVNTKRRNCPVAQVIVLMLSTGCRRGEALAADWSQFDFTSRTWRIPARVAKNRRLVGIPINDAAIALLNRIPRRTGEDHVFRSRTTGKRLKYISKTFARIASEASIENFTPHDTRRSFGTLALNNGVSIHAVSKLLRHADTKITEQRYAFVSTDVLHEAADCVSRVLTEASEKSAAVIPLKPRAA